MPIYQIVLLSALGFVPSIVWLNFYYREDCHPEPKHLLTKVFLMGIILSPLAILFQLLLIKCGTLSILEKICLPIGFLQPASPEFLLWSAFVEEIVKFYAVRLIILHDPAFDEPIDAMIYMIAAGLGFAAIENVLVVLQTTPDGFYVTINNAGGRVELDPKDVRTIREQYQRTKTCLSERLDSLHQLADKMYAQLIGRDQR